jgi:fimbrial chaperone protein
MSIYHNLAGRCALAALLLALVSAFGSTALAATLSINPLRIELDARHRTDIINLKNTAESPLRLQVRTMVWTMADDGQWQLTPSKDLIVTPELVEIAPGQGVELRVGILADPGAAGEGAYRLLLDELPNQDAAPAALSEIHVLTQISMPVFLEPSRRTRVPSLASAAVKHGMLALGLGDVGTQRLDPQRVKVALLDGAGHVIDQREMTENYVLPGRTWYLNIKLPAASCERAASVSVTWPDLANTSLNQAITTDAQACDGAGPP